MAAVVPAAAAAAACWALANAYACATYAGNGFGAALRSRAEDNPALLASPSMPTTSTGGNKVNSRTVKRCKKSGCR